MHRLRLRSPDLPPWRGGLLTAPDSVTQSTGLHGAEGRSGGWPVLPPSTPCRPVDCVLCDSRDACRLRPADRGCTLALLRCSGKFIIADVQMVCDTLVLLCLSSCTLCVELGRSDYGTVVHTFIGVHKFIVGLLLLLDISCFVPWPSCSVSSVAKPGAGIAMPDLCRCFLLSTCNMCRHTFVSTQ